MKTYFKVFILLLIMFITPNVFAKDKVSIESVTLEDKAAAVSEKSKPTINGLNVDFDLSFSKLNDYARYKVVVDNPTKNDYEISKDNNFNISDYIDYSYEFDHDSNIVKANSKLTMYIVITYKKLVPSDKLVDGKYVENNKMAISLSNDDIIVNPKTGVNVAIVLTLLMVVSVSIILYKTNKNKKYLNLLVIGLLLIPVTGYALEKIRINVNTVVTIEEKYEVMYSYWSAIPEDEVNLYKKALTEKELNDFPSNEYYYMINGKKYSLYYVTKSDGYYAPGETVTVKDQDRYLQIYCNSDDMTQDASGDYICSNGSLDMKTTVLSDTDVWKYNIQNATDEAVMNFTGQGYFEIETYDLGSGNQDIAFVGIPKTFTMPAHDVELYNHSTGVDVALSSPRL